MGVLRENLGGPEEGFGVLGMEFGVLVGFRGAGGALEESWRGFGGDFEGDLRVLREGWGSCGRSRCPGWGALRGWRGFLMGSGEDFGGF